MFNKVTNPEHLRNLHAQHAQFVDECLGLDAISPSFMIQKYDHTKLWDKSEIKKLDETLFKEIAPEEFYEVDGYFIRNPETCDIISYLLYEIKSSNSLYISSLGTKPNFEGRGLASMLVRKILNSYPNYTITLKVNMFDLKSQGLLRFYEKFGFKTIYSSVTMQYEPK